MQLAFHNVLHAIPYQGRVRTMLPYRLDGCTSTAHKYHIKDCVRKVLPWRLDGCNSSPRLALSRIAFGWCCLVIWIYATVFPYLWLWRKSDFLSKTDECPDVLLRRPDGCNLELFETSRHWWASGRNYHIIRMDVADWWALGCFSGPSEQKQRIWLFWVGICTESSLHTEIVFLQLVTL
jgi:hypothetical protein